ncbi:MAG TPA: phosphotransferase family protein [Candidatus Binataceae bacterium]|nr:phosphotransferase family protein [Candidatus Binataceae bacterium]
MSNSSTEKTGPNAAVDIAGLRNFIRDTGLGDAYDLSTKNISFGHSNEVHLVQFHGKSWVLRRPPRGPLLPTAHDVMREYRVLKALQDTPVPIPRVYAACDDPRYIGAPFYLMEYMRGEVIRGGVRNFATTPERRRAVSERMIDLLVELQKVDWRAVGLEGFGRPDGYLERQLKRWVDQLQRTTPHTRPLPVMDKVRDWLQAHLPESPPATIVHGDFKLDNVMWDPTDPPKPLAILDWEMSTIGDPLADLGWLLSYWTGPGDSPGGVGGMATVEAEAGFLSRREMLDRYEAKTGRRMTYFPFYQAFAIFKLAIIMEGSYSRFVMGQADDPLFAEMKDRVPALAENAWRVCQSAQ